ncbi:MAG: putative metal-binding motif-containing protein [Myxococcota bacterium]|nr:putative metal-binding motif-containing protein [Myxococcota bacterium]
MSRSVLVFILGLGCTSNKYSITEKSTCDGELQSDEETVDSPYDRDGDGYFDASNPDCEATYDAADLDCDDLDPEINPGASEINCDGIDNDCNGETLDESDIDGDGYTSCEDCADSIPTINPGMTEVPCDNLDNDCNEATPDSSDVDEDGYSDCEDCADDDPNINPGMTEVECNGIDDDCDEETLDGEDLDGDGSPGCLDCDDSNALNFPENIETCDGMDNDCDALIDELEECEPEDDYSDTWIVIPPVSFSCASNSVTINLSALEIIDAYPVILVSGLSGTQPGSMSGEFISATEFEATNFISSGGAGCDETYTITGTFTSSTSFEATFTAAYYDASGTGFGCGDSMFFPPMCTDQSFTISGTR